jgi:hypothetical protein
MKKTLIYLAAVALLAACRGGGPGSLPRKDQQKYDVVQEGQASGVTSTINAPGEAPPPPAAMTGTNADTTTNFTTLTGVSTTTAPTQPGTLAGSMQIPPAAPTRDYPTNPPPRARTEHPTRPPETHVDPSTSTSVEGTPPPPNDTATPPADTQPPPTTTTT